MTSLEVQPFKALRGTIALPGDKSISHRSLILNGLAVGSARIEGLLASEDVAASARCMRALGVRIEIDGSGATQVHGSGGRLRAPVEDLDCGNSGTTMRLLCGALAAQPIQSTLRGDASLSRRPMSRVTVPLRDMGAQIFGDEDARFAPLRILGGGLEGRLHRSAIASAQVRSALLLAGLGAEGLTRIWQPAWSRDHTERMLQAMGVDLVIESGEGIEVSVQGGQVLQALDVVVPADVSSAAFFLVAAAATEGSDLVLPGVGLNPTRTGVIDVLRRMGADIEILGLDDHGTEPVGDVRVRGGGLRGVTMGGCEIPRVIDEIPVLAVAASLAIGETLVRDAGELRVKESDRIKSTVAMLRALGAEVEERADGFLIAGRSGSPLPGGGEILTQGDHRIAMAGVVGASLSGRPSVVHGIQSMDVSFPGFAQTMDAVRVS